MSWFLIALITPITHAAANHIDKHILSRYLKGGQIGSLVLFSAFFGIVFLPFIGWFHPEAFAVGPRDIALLLVNGAFSVLALLFYFKALDRDEASYVVPLFQMVPVMSFVLGYVILGESLTAQNAAASLLIVSGSIVLAIEMGKGKWHMKREVLLFMVLSSLCITLNGILFKFVTGNVQAFWPSLFWDFAGKVVFGAILFFFLTNYRRAFFSFLRENKTSMLALVAVNELIFLIGEGALAFAVLLAPVALVQVVSGFQPAFVFVYGVLLTRFFPQFGVESMTKRHLLQKGIGIAVIILGTALLR